MVEIDVEIQVSDNQDSSPDVWLEAVISADSENERGDGNTSRDIDIKEDGRIFLRAERSGLLDNRIYTIVFKAKDDAGNVTSEKKTVTVTHDEGRK
ncbi:hypothetical protein [Ferrimonas gelatinilytica]|uniref:Ig-like domain-containing protein n=1 Tax=Ferrimonas gelatinilytica TaxID=1255257 RepID=A0ABP9RU48_9GAMM